MSYTFLSNLDRSFSLGRPWTPGKALLCSKAFRKTYYIGGWAKSDRGTTLRLPRLATVGFRMYSLEFLGF